LEFKFEAKEAIPSEACPLFDTIGKYCDLSLVILEYATVPVAIRPLII
jgi:hypothetical protein